MNNFHDNKKASTLTGYVPNFILVDEPSDEASDKPSDKGDRKD